MSDRFRNLSPSELLAIAETVTDRHEVVAFASAAIMCLQGAASTAIFEKIGKMGTTPIDEVSQSEFDEVMNECNSRLQDATQ
ncbi:hypothetical protein KKF55_04230 [Patescibacteria group bacterium]|nr:hypothetical protein [Patescibacteria group bacterium]